MDKRASHSLTGTIDGDSAVTHEAAARAGQPVVDGAGTHRSLDLKKVFRAIAARIDVVLDEKVAAGAEPVAGHRAARAWSSVIAKQDTDATSELRRHALATTVLRMSADGRVDVDDQNARAVDDADHDAEQNVAPSVAEGAAEGIAERRDALDRQPASEPFVAEITEASAIPQRVEIAPSYDVTSVHPSAAATDRSDVEERLRAVRERMATRRTSVAAARVDPPDARASRRRVSVWRRTDTRTLVQRLLIGLAIVGASAVVSILIT